MTKLPSLRKDFSSAITRLYEALALPKNSIVRDSCIQRFEIAFELCWKMLKRAGSGKLDSRLSGFSA